MNNPELEKDSAPTFIEFLNRRNIKHVIFDIDNTLLATHVFFRELLYKLGVDVATDMDIDPHYFLVDEISRQLEIGVYKEYYDNNRQPELIDAQFTRALKKHFQDIGDGRITERMKTLISEASSRCYTSSPKAFEGLKELFQLIVESERTISYHSHAQEPWTDIKVEYMSSISSMEPFPYLATPIDQKKDVEAWKKAINQSKQEVEEILVIGDNFEADIIPAMQAGVKNFVWINKLERSIPQDFVLPEDVCIYTVNELSEIPDGVF
jgi:FMN phosphatase YigB (HAD superfamily)